MNRSDRRRKLPSLQVQSHSRSTTPLQMSPQADERPRLNKRRDTDSGSKKSLSSVSSMPDLKATVKRPNVIQRASRYLTATYGKPSEPDFFDNVDQSVEAQVPVEQVVWALQNEVLASMFKPLDKQHNGSIMRVLESYMNLKAECELLNEKLEAVIEQNDAAFDMFEQERQAWRDEEALYTAEVKRLEVLIAEGRTGLEQVTLARSQSLLRRRTVVAPRRITVVAAPRTAEKVETKSESPVKAEHSNQNPALLRPRTPSSMMQMLSKSIKAHGSFLSVDLVPERPPSRAPVVSLAKVEVPPEWRKRSETVSTNGSAVGSPARTETSSLETASHFGDVLPDEAAQALLNRQAIEHVARLLSDGQDVSIADAVNFLEQCIMQVDRTSDMIYNFISRPRGLSLSKSETSSDKMPTIRVAKNKTSQGHSENTPPRMPQPTRTGHGRPFSFSIGDDDSIAPNLNQGHARVVSNSWSSPTSKSPHRNMLLRRTSSLIPSPIPDYVLARPRREDSSSSVITSIPRSPLEVPSESSSDTTTRAPSVQRSPVKHTSPIERTVTVKRASSVLPNRSNERPPFTPRMANRTGSMRSTMTAIRIKPSAQSAEKEKSVDKDEEEPKEESKADVENASDLRLKKAAVRKARKKPNTEQKNDV